MTKTKSEIEALAELKAAEYGKPELRTDKVWEFGIKMFEAGYTACQEEDKDKINVDKYILEECLDALRMTANTLKSRQRLTCMDRTIEYSERLLKWVLSNGKEEDRPKLIPKPPEK